MPDGPSRCLRISPELMVMINWRRCRPVGVVPGVGDVPGTGAVPSASGAGVVQVGVVPGAVVLPGVVLTRIRAT